MTVDANGDPVGYACPPKLDRRMQNDYYPFWNDNDGNK